MNSDITTNKKNIIIITIDNLRYDCFDLKNSLIKSKNKFTKYLLNKSINFKETIAPGPNTAYSFPGIMSSVPSYKYAEEIVTEFPLHNTYPLKISQNREMLAEILKKNGYTTIAIQDSNPLISKYFNYNKGFDIFIDGMEDENKNRNYLLKKIRNFMLPFFRKSKIAKRFAWGLESLLHLGDINGAENISKKVISNIKQVNQSKPIFIWIHFMDTHIMYSPVNKLKERINWFKQVLLNINKEWNTLSQSKIKTLKKLYLYEAEYTYNILFDLIQNKLPSLGINLDNTYLFVTADHGEEFLEHGDLFHKNKLYDELIKVPLIVSGPNINARSISEQISLYDIAPTILDLVNIKIPKEFKGKSLKPFILHNNTIYKESIVISSILDESKVWKISARTPKHKCIFRINNKTIIDALYYNLELDPKEKVKIPISKTPKNIIKKIKKKLKDEGII